MVNTGILNPENFADVLRQISHRRRQGMLEIAFADLRVKIAFYNGKIVEVYRGSVPPLEEFIEWLITAQVLPKEFDSSSVKRYSDLYIVSQSLNSEALRPLDEKSFRSLLRHRTMEKIFKLQLQQGAIYTFQPELVEIDPDFSPSISVGQLLLDMVALESDEEKFDQEFTPHLVLSRTEKPLTAQLTLDERYIVDLLKESSTVESLAQRSLMSSYHFRETLINLKSGGFIVVGAKGKVSPKNEKSRTRTSSSLPSHETPPPLDSESSDPPSQEVPSKVPSGRKRRLTDVFQQMNFGDAALSSLPPPDETPADTSLSSYEENQEPPDGMSEAERAFAQTLLERSRLRSSTKEQSSWQEDIGVTNQSTSAASSRGKKSRKDEQKRNENSVEKEISPLSGRTSGRFGQAISMLSRRAASSPLTASSLYWSFALLSIVIPLLFW
jgi:Domain of unknown function (DUF4388)